ncbi:TPA: hypothetical protein QFD67_002156 [Enterococcus faecium]
MLKKSQLIIGSIILGILGFSPMLLSVINQGNKKGELKINSNYYNSPNEEFFLKESDKQKKTALTSSSK